MRISDWSSDVGAPDLLAHGRAIACHVKLLPHRRVGGVRPQGGQGRNDGAWQDRQRSGSLRALKQRQFAVGAIACRATVGGDHDRERDGRAERFGRDIRFVHAAQNAWVQGELLRSEEHTSELQSLMRISYAFFCLKKKKEKAADSMYN